MSTTPIKKKKRPAAKKPKYLPLIAGLAVVWVLAAAVVFLRSALTEDPEPTATSETTTAPTLPPNPYTPADLVYDENGYMTCAAGACRLGIDVSDHQLQIDWPQVADAGVEFAFVRIGYRGYTQGQIYADESAAANLTGAKAAGLDVGAYFYSQALNEQEAAEEAAFCIELLKEYEIDLPVVFDWEYVSTDARTGAMDAATLTACAKAFCEAIEAAGYEAMIYANPDISRNMLDMFQLQDYSFWLAMYSDTMNYRDKVDYWQYTCTGTVPGIETNVDINLQLIYD